MRLIRVFPRRTKATPDDDLAYFGPSDLFAQADEVHVSVTFTYDKPVARRAAGEGVGSSSAGEGRGVLKASEELFG